MSETIDSVDDKVFGRVWKFTTEIGAQERHFNGLQSTYRNMASAWLLATFGGMGFAVTQTIHVGLPRELVLALVALAGGAGIALLWVIDLLVYHRLLISCFAEGVMLEHRYPWLPQIRHNMRTTQPGGSVRMRVIWFYLAPVAFLMIVAGAALSMWLYRLGSPLAAVIVVLAAIVLAWAVGAAMHRLTASTAVLAQRLTEAEGLPPA
jgi:hypothetical protein